MFVLSTFNLNVIDKNSSVIESTYGTLTIDFAGKILSKIQCLLGKRETTFPSIEYFYLTTVHSIIHK